MSDRLWDLASAEWVGRWGMEQQLPPSAVPTPFERWNRICGGGGGGLGPAHGWFVTIGGNPGFGKSLVALNLAAWALKHRESIGFVTLEMSPTALATRLYPIATGAPVRSFERGKGFDPTTIQVAQAWAAKLKADGCQAMVNSEVLGSLDHVLDVMAEMRDSGARVLFLDYVQLVATGDDDAIYKAVATISTNVRKFAHESEVLVYGLSQFNRGTSGNYHETPRSQGLHGGMALEANSDQVLLIDHSRFERDRLNTDLARTYLRLDKNRHGAVGDIPVLWDYRSLQCREALPDEETQWEQIGRSAA